MLAARRGWPGRARDPLPLLFTSLRRLLPSTPLLAAIAAAFALAGCGSSAPSSSPLGSALSYFPPGTPFVMSVATDPNAPAVKNAQAMLQRLPFVSLGEAGLMSQLQRVGINYDTDVRPLFGNPVLLGIAGSTAHASARTRILLAWVTKDAGTLAGLIGKTHLPKAGSHDGATLYSAGTAELAVDGATLLVASSPELVESALDLHAHGGGMTPADYTRETSGLPQNALVYAVGQLSQILAANAPKALTVPWVRALRGYGASVSASSSGLSIRYRLDTSATTLSSTELPLSAGATPPSLAGTAPIQFGLRDPGASVRFALAAEQEAEPQKFAADMARLAAAERKTGVNFQRDVLGQIGSNAAVNSDGRSFMARVDVVNPAAAQRTLRKLGTSIGAFFTLKHGETVTTGPGSFDTVHHPGGKDIVFGLVGNEFVAGTTGPTQLKEFAAVTETAAPAAQGAAAFRVSLPALLAVMLHRAPAGIAGQVLGMLGDVTGWTAASPGALTGTAALALK